MLSLTVSSQVGHGQQGQGQRQIEELHFYGESMKQVHTNQCFAKGEELCYRNLYFYFQHGESTSTASQKSKDLNKVSILLQDLGLNGDYVYKRGKMENSSVNTNQMSQLNHKAGPGQ